VNRVSKVRVGIRVSDRIRVGLLLVMAGIGFPDVD